MWLMQTRQNSCHTPVMGLKIANNCSYIHPVLLGQVSFENCNTVDHIYSYTIYLWFIVIQKFLVLQRQEGQILSGQKSCLNSMQKVTQ